jgi:hypothetical protein
VVLCVVTPYSLVAVYRTFRRSVAIVNVISYFLCVWCLKFGSYCGPLCHDSEQSGSCLPDVSEERSYCKRHLIFTCFFFRFFYIIRILSLHCYLPSQSVGNYLLQYVLRLSFYASLSSLNTAFCYVSSSVRIPAECYPSFPIRVVPAPSRNKCFLLIHLYVLGLKRGTKTVFILGFIVQLDSTYWFWYFYYLLSTCFGNPISHLSQLRLSNSAMTRINV